ncbi:MAG: hypothetical protein ACK53U_11790 [Alphaproteobacteria bacterium]|jgi:hypothetical protein|nr:hypothetical protein [Acetobacteraceae bacterium]
MGMNPSLTENTQHPQTDPALFVFLWVTLGIIFVTLSAGVFGKITRRPDRMSIVAFFVFYFLGPLLYFLAIWMINPLTSIVSGMPIERAFFISLNTVAAVWFIYFPQCFILVSQGMFRLLGISRYTFWLKRRLWLGFILDLARALRAIGLPVVAAWVKARSIPRGGYQVWKVTWGSYFIFFLGAFWTLLLIGGHQ